jgi:putative transposase
MLHAHSCRRSASAFSKVSPAALATRQATQPWLKLLPSNSQLIVFRCSSVTAQSLEPKSLHAKAKRALQEIWMAETRTAAEAAFDGFIESYGVKYDKAVECLSKDREPLLAFYDFPAEHWKYLRTTNPIESTFATVRHRTVRSRGCLSTKTALAMIYKLAQAAEKSWNRLRGHNLLPKVILGVKFNDGIEVVKSQAQAAAA